MKPEFITDLAEKPRATFLLAHGAGTPMDTPFMSAFAHGLCAAGYSVARFEFAYMASRRVDGRKRPPPRGDMLLDEFRAAIAGMETTGPLVIGGKSMGGRVASMIAGEQHDAGRAAGLVCLGYPFHPPGKPEKLRTAHLYDLAVPALVVQGERDPFGGANEVPGYGLPAGIRFHWAEDGDHSLVPRKRSGLTAEENWNRAVSAIAAWTREIA